MNLRRGNTYTLKVDLKSNGEYLDYSQIEKIEFIFGEVNKTILNKDFNIDGNSLIIEFSQEETFKLDYTISYQVRVKFKTGDVIASEIYSDNIKDCLSTHVL